jgi:hypothetical protein
MMAADECCAEVQRKIAAAVHAYNVEMILVYARYHKAKQAANVKYRAALRVAGQQLAAEREGVETKYHRVMDAIDAEVEMVEEERWKGQATRIADYVKDRLAALRESA